MKQGCSSIRYSYSVFCFLRGLIIFVLWGFGTHSVSADAQPLLWLVEDKLTQGKVYLFGSVHYGTETFYPLPDSVMNAYASSDVLAVELDIDLLPVTQIQDILQRQGYYRGNTKLPLQAGKLLWERLTKLCEQLAVDPDIYIRTKPWLVAMQLTNLQLSRSGYQQSLGLDKYFLTLARDKKPILELESLDDQIRLFAQLSETDQLQFLENTLEEFAKGDATLKSLADAWYNGDEVALENGVLGAFRNQKIGKKLYPLIFVERNKQMAATIVEFLASSKNVFLVVGIGHMLGDDGLIILLRQKGYRVTKVNSDSY